VRGRLNTQTLGKDTDSNRDPAPPPPKLTATSQLDLRCRGTALLGSSTTLKRGHHDPPSHPLVAGLCMNSSPLAASSDPIEVFPSPDTCLEAIHPSDHLRQGCATKTGVTNQQLFASEVVTLMPVIEPRLDPLLMPSCCSLINRSTLRFLHLPDPKPSVMRAVPSSRVGWIVTSMKCQPLPKW